MFFAGFEQVSAQTLNYFDINFGNYTAIGGQTRPAPNTTVGDSYTTAREIRFTDVAVDSGYNINLRVTAADVGQRYSYLGSFPNYKYSNGAIEPNGDLGYYYQYNGGTNVPSDSPLRYGGINYTLEFFDGNAGGGVDEPFALPAFRLLIYDVDGEAQQTESVRVYFDEGFVGYQLPKSGTISVEYFTDSVLFTGPGYDEPEDNPSGMFILYFKNTSKITLSMESHTRTGTSANGVFFSH